MQIKTALIAASLVGFGSGVFAAEFVKLSGAEIEAALDDHRLIYDLETSQDFEASGRTLYYSGRESLGYWRIQGDQYCSTWPPNAGWECYDVERSGDVIRFISSRGHITDGRFPD